MKYIGNEYARVDGRDKLSGSAKYVEDYYEEDMLYVSVVRSSIPFGRITKIDKDEAMIEGVEGIYTASDFPGGSEYGFPICDDQILTNGMVRYIGDAIAIVCAQTKETANKAASLVTVKYEKLEPVFDVNKSSKLIKKLVVKKNPQGYKRDKDDITLTMDLSTKHQEHMYIEPEGAFAFMKDGRINVYAPMQSPFVARGIIAKALGFKEDDVRVVQTTVGGAFGGKDDVEYEACGFAALGTFKTRRPCKFNASREESVISSYKRHPMYENISLSCDAEGKFKSIKVRNKMDGGAYAAASTFVQYRNTTHSAGPYVYNSVDVENELYYTNNIYCGAFRGFGGLQACFFYDTIIDEMAYKLNMDPLDLRLKNIWRKGTTTPTNQNVNWDPSVENILKRIRKVSDWDEKRNEFESFNKTNKYYKKGIGISLGYHGISLGAEGADFAESEVIYEKDRKKFLVTCGISELGQGSRTVFSQIASEELGLQQKFIEVNNYDTDKIKNSGPTVASRGTTVGGRAVQIACQNFINVIMKMAPEYYKVSVSQISCNDGNIYIDGESKISILELCEILSNEHEIKSSGRFDMPNIDWSEETGLGIPYVSYHYGAHVCYLTVDVITGMVTIEKYFAIHDIGKVINPVALKGQINGGVAMGIGYSLMEDLEIHDGIIENTNYDSYIIPTSMDVPDIYSEAYESIEPLGPFGAKGTGEPVLTPVPACIGNAIRFATGKRLTSLPFSLEKIVLGKDLYKYGK